MRLIMAQSKKMRKNMKKNYKMTIAYDGSRYYGWEHQPGIELTIQGKIESVLNKMLSLKKGDSVKLISSGRTDAGVHARAMCANVHMDTKLSEKEIKDYLQSYLPEDISVNEVKIAGDRFHARYNAKGKTYRYSFYYGEDKPVFERKYLSILDKKPNTDKMRHAARLMMGEHDFKSFCGNNKMKKSTVRNLDNIEIREDGPYIRIYVHGDGFLQNMVRIIAGTLLEVGYGKINPSDIPAIIEAKDRQKAGFTAEARGLCLMKVDYN